MDDSTWLRVARFVQHEAFLLDERRWEDWLDLYEPQAEYWVPMWDDDGELTRDPQTELSLMYYARRNGLEDRVFRIKTGKSAATMPLARTCHIRTQPLVSREDGLLVARFNWSTHSARMGTAVTYFGRKVLHLSDNADTLRIRKAYTVVQNDLLDQVIDIYHL